MQVEPGAGAFADKYEAGAPQLVYTRLVSDLETPVSAFLKLAGSREAMARLARCMADLWAAAPEELDKADVILPLDPTV